MATSPQQQLSLRHNVPGTCLRSRAANAYGRFRGAASGMHPARPAGFEPATSRSGGEPRGVAEGAGAWFYGRFAAVATRFDPPSEECGHVVGTLAVLCRRDLRRSRPRR
jgi:hypothetical protein